MSYILDALKKTEQEKARKARGNSLSGISGALFDAPPARQSFLPGWKSAILILILAVAATFAITWFVLRPSRPTARPALPPAVPATATAPTTLEQPVVPSSIPASTPLPPATATPKAQATTPQPAPQTSRQKVSAASPAPVTAKGTSVSPVTIQPSPAKTEAVKPTDDAAMRLTMQELGRRQLGRKLAPEQTIPPPTGIVLSGIAWQEERRARRAVVNGFLMQEGGVVSGARIVEIYQDRVRFGMSGKYFELFLVSAAVPAPGK